AEICGNGLRALTLFLLKYNALGSEQIIESKDGIHEIKFQGNKPKVRMFIFKESLKEKTLHIDNKKIKGYIINSGVPHFVILTEDIENPKIMETAKKVRFNSFFEPSGTNVDFIKKTKSGKIMIRTYERGVEAETLSCGSGAVAAYYIGRKILKLKSPIKVISKGGELIVSEEKDKIFLSGEVKEVYRGIFDLADIQF
ncbi:MAG: diaminopimelate epimerase, partial [Candidatus Helarchaeota archaeon]|nr:diaminopimelate epimerase [Candidatus Helarchaeota archaeon]